jgi:hypothetical protein
MPSLKILTVLPASAVPVNVGVVSFVILSVFEEPLSVAAVMSGVDGAAGAVLSIVNVLPLPGVSVPAESCPLERTV